MKTPVGKLDTIGLIIINPDQGASEDYGDISYQLPELPAPAGKVYAEIVRDQRNRTDRAIKVFWNGVTGASEYEIYVVRGSREEFLGSTRLSSYIFNDIEPRTRYRFIVKAVGDFGSSKPSQESNWVQTGSSVGPPDEDGKLGEKTEMKRQGSVALVNVGSRDNSRIPIQVDLTQGDLAGSSQVVVAIPASVAANSSSPDIDIQGRDFKLRFNPRVFNTALVNSNRHRDEAGVRLQMAPLTGTPPASSTNPVSYTHLQWGYYTITKNNSQQPVLSDGIQEWIFTYNGTAIVASDKSGNSYTVSMKVEGDHDQLTLTGTGSPLDLEILTPYKVENNIIAVSYTHLDVYKRQVFHTDRRKAGKSRINRVIARWDNGLH